MGANYSKSLYNDYEKLVIKNKELSQENKFLKLQINIAESEKQRLEKINFQKRKQYEEAIYENIALKNKIIELTKKLNMTEYERDQYLAKLNIDGTNAGIPTSQTPINKNKLIPNSRKNTGGKIGGKPNHKKSKLETFADEEINENEDIILDECPECGSKKLIELESEITKDEFDYQVKIIKKRIHFKEYKCPNCNKIVRKNIPVCLKEDNQYGNNVQATALTLMNIGNVPMNKVRKIICGLTMNEINLSEGYIAKLQKRAASKLEKFIIDLKFYIVHLNLLYWDDTVIMINKNRSCMRFYGNEDVALYCAHMHKDKEGLDKDNILKLLSENTVVEHDHNKVNYNDEYSFINAECCQHLIRDLEKVKTNIPDRTWCTKLKELFIEYDHKRNVLILEKKDHFSEEEFNEFISKINQFLLLGTEEHLADSEVYYANEEKALLIRLMEYRDNYIYWTIDFNLPFTNNLSERALRGIKSKMKISGQFQNIASAEYYAIIRSYIETCYRNNVNGHEALISLMNNEPYTLSEILEIGKQNAERAK
ncbi:MAG: transposase [Bacilli bacterium]